MALLLAAALALPALLPARPRLAVDERYGEALRGLWRSQAGEELAVDVAPPPGVQGPPVTVRMSAAAVRDANPAAPYSAGLDPSWSRRHVASHLPHWRAPPELPAHYDARLAFPACSSMRAIQNQGACSGCYSFATVASLGDRICQRTNGSTDAILSAEAPLFCPNLGGCRGGNLGPVWEYLENVGVPSGCSPGQNSQPSGSDGSNSNTQPQSAASWTAQAAATAGGCCYPVARRTMESNNPTCLQQPCPGGACPVRTPGGDPGVGKCVDWWGNTTTNTSLEWRHFRAVPNSTHGFHNNTAIMSGLMAHGPISTGIWLCAGDNKPANLSSPVYRGGLTGYKGGVYDCPRYGCGLAFHAVLIIGWGHDDRSGLDYWTVRNSWGDNWGEDHLNPGANCSKGEW